MRLLRRDPQATSAAGPNTIQGLDLTSFIEAENEGVIRRIEIQPDDVSNRQTVGPLTT